MLKSDSVKAQIDIISDTVKTIGLLARATFDRNVGIDNVYLKSFLPLLPSLMKLGFSGADANYHAHLTNIVIKFFE
jgi:fused